MDAPIRAWGTGRRARPRKEPPTADQRFDRHLVEGPVPPGHPDLGPCLLWQSSRGDGRTAYPKFRLGGKGSPQVEAHRFAYERAYGPVPPGRVVHHRCEVTRCVRREHLEAVTPGEHLHKSDLTFQAVNAAKASCIHGHAFDTENTYHRRSGGRACRACQRDHIRRWRAGQKGLNPCGS